MFLCSYVYSPGVPSDLIPNQTFGMRLYSPFPAAAISDTEMLPASVSPLSSPLSLNCNSRGAKISHSVHMSYFLFSTYAMYAVTYHVWYICRIRCLKSECIGIVGEGRLSVKPAPEITDPPVPF